MTQSGISNRSIYLENVEYDVIGCAAGVVPIVGRPENSVTSIGSTAQKLHRRRLSSPRDWSLVLMTKLRLASVLAVSGKAKLIFESASSYWQQLGGNRCVGDEWLVT